jgi:hypothetical protein
MLTRYMPLLNEPWRSNVVLYHFALHIHPKMRRYFPRQRDETFAVRSAMLRDEEVVGSAGRRTERPPRRGDVDASASLSISKEQADWIVFYVQMVLLREVVPTGSRCRPEKWSGHQRAGGCRALGPSVAKLPRSPCKLQYRKTMGLFPRAEVLTTTASGGTIST